MALNTDYVGLQLPSSTPGLGLNYDSMSAWGNPAYALASQTPAYTGLPASITNPIATPGGSWLDSIGGLDGAKVGLGAIGGLANAFMAMQQYGLAKKTLAENQRQFDLNYGAQRDTTNTQMADRQAARVASNPGFYQSVDDYMAANRIK